MSDLLIQGLRARLGIPATAQVNDVVLLAALDEVLAEQTEPTRAQIPAGSMLVTQARWEEMQAKAALGVAAHNREVEANREATIMSAVSAGRIPPSRANHWRAMLKADPGAVDALTAIPANTIPVKAIGYTGGVTEHSDDDQNYSSLFGEDDE